MLRDVRELLDAQWVIVPRESNSENIAQSGITTDWSRAAGCGRLVLKVIAHEEVRIAADFTIEHGTVELHVIALRGIQLLIA